MRLRTGAADPSSSAPGRRVCPADPLRGVEAPGVSYAIRLPADDGPGAGSRGPAQPPPARNATGRGGAARVL